MNFNRQPIFHLRFLISFADIKASFPSLASLSLRMDCFPKNFDLNLEIEKCFADLIRHQLLFFFDPPLPVSKVSVFLALQPAFFIFPSPATISLLFLFEVKQLFSQLPIFFSKLQLQQFFWLALLFSIFLPWVSILLLFAVDLLLPRVAPLLILLHPLHQDLRYHIHRFHNLDNHLINHNPNCHHFHPQLQLFHQLFKQAIHSPKSFIFI